MDTNLTNIDFITNFTELESLCVVGQSDNPKSIMNSIPSLRNAQNLEYVYLFCVNVEDLDFISDNPSLKYLTVIPEHAVISDLSGLKNKEKLQILELENVVCEDYSVLLELTALAESVQDKSNNYTRFICISKNPEIYAGANKTSIMMTIPHKPGSLYKILSRLYVLGINLNKLESRPLPDRDFEFMFYFDLETSIYSEEFIQLMCELDDLCEEFKYLGSYSEVV